MTFGYSRDDSGKFLVPYIEQKILPTDPFDTIDQGGVGQLMKMAIASARKRHSIIKLAGERAIAEELRRERGAILLAAPGMQRMRDTACGMM